MQALMKTTRTSVLAFHLKIQIPSRSLGLKRLECDHKRRKMQFILLQWNEIQACNPNCCFGPSRLTLS